MAALASRQLGDGHPCLDLHAVSALAEEHDWPLVWTELLTDSQPFTSPLLAGANGLPANAPLVLDQHRVYLRRYWDYERRVARGIVARLDQSAPPAEDLRDELQHLFPAAANNDLDWPRIACALAARSAFSVITGGPGTGKTTTVVRLLGLLQTLHLREHSTPLRMRLAAPTGKAAARLNASIAKQIAQLDVTNKFALPSRSKSKHSIACLAHARIGDSMRTTVSIPCTWTCW